MRVIKLLGAILTTVLFTAYQAAAQDYEALAGAEVPPVHSGGFFSVVLSSGSLGVLIWAAIFLWAFALLPIGITSIVHAARLRSKRWPLATKLLLFGPVMLFVLGWFGFIQGVIGMGCTVACGAPDIALLGMYIAQSLYSVSGTLFLMHLYLVVFLISFIILHLKFRQMDKDS